MIQSVFQSHKSAKVSNIIRQGQWRWPWSSAGDLLHLKQTILALPPPNCQDSDSVSWILNGSGQFTIRSAWEFIRSRQVQLDWTKLAWFSNNIPKLAFCLWLAIQQRLGTKDRGYNTDLNLNCILCNHQLEDHAHLFFDCAISSQIWRVMKTKCHLQAPSLGWNDLIAWLAQEWRGSSFQLYIWKLCLAGTVYTIWQERNSRLHHNRPRNASQICDHITWMLRSKLSSLKGIPDIAVNRRSQLRWNLPESIFEDL